MKDYIYTIDGMDILIEQKSLDKSIDDHGRRLQAYCVRKIREQAGMERKSFCEWLGIPYRTLQDWELGQRVMPDYVLRLIAYKVRMEKSAGRI